jgi:chromosome segregation ATPase
VIINIEDLVQSLSERQLAAERQLSELSSAFKALEARVAELSRSAASLPAGAQKPAMEAATSAVGAVQPIKEEVTPELLVILAAAATAYLGKNVRIRTARMLQPSYEVINPWAQQGRVFVHASHNLRSRR